MNIMGIEFDPKKRAETAEQISARKKRHEEREEEIAKKAVASKSRFEASLRELEMLLDKKAASG